MTKQIYSLILCLVSTSVLAKDFKYNYKNINTIASIICEALPTTAQANETVVSRFNVNRTKLNEQGKELQVEVNGTCNAVINHKSKEIISFGQELNLQFTINKKISLTGQVGLDQVQARFKGKRPLAIKISNPYTNELQSIDIARTRWSNKNTLINFAKKDNIQIRSKGRIIASEIDSTLKTASGSYYYNIWRFSTSGCRTHAKISSEDCDQLANILN